MNELWLACIAGAGFSVAALFGLAGIGVSNVLRLASVSIAAGILLAITFSDLVPDAIEAAGRTGASFGFVTGFAALFLMEIVSKAHTHHHDAPSSGRGTSDRTAIDLHAHAYSVWPFVLGLLVHNLSDGLAIGTTRALPDAAASAVMLGVLVHQLPVGISFAAVLTAQRASARFVVRTALGLGLAIPLGAACIAAIPLNRSGLGVLVAVAGGALTYVAAGHLLPEAHSEERHGIVGPVFVVTLFATTALFTLGIAG